MQNSSRVDHQVPRNVVIRGAQKFSFYQASVLQATAAAGTRDVAVYAEEMARTKTSVFTSKSNKVSCETMAMSRIVKTSHTSSA